MNLNSLGVCVVSSVPISTPKIRWGLFCTYRISTKKCINMFSSFTWKVTTSSYYHSLCQHNYLLRKFYSEIRLLTHENIVSENLCKPTYLCLLIGANSCLIRTTACSPGHKASLSWQWSSHQDWFQDPGLGMSTHLKLLCHELWHELWITFLAFKVLHQTTGV